MRKGGWGGITAILLLFVLAGCTDIPTDYTLTNINPLAELSAPQMETPIVMDGVVILQWQPVKDASGYRIVRRDTVTGTSVERQATTSNLYYIDTVSYGNQMVDARKYEYSIISLSNANTAIQNGIAKVEATAKIPANFTPVIGDITATLYKSTNNNTDIGDRILVTFPNAANQKYQVVYSYGQNAIVRDFEVTFDGSNNTTGNWYDPVKTVTFPAIGGTNSVTVKAWFTGSQDYYSESAVKTYSVPSVVLAATLNAVSNFTASRQQGGVSLTWSNVPNATSYSIYRAVISNNSSTPIITANSSVVTVTGDWVAVTATPEYVNSSSRWQAFDAQTSGSSYFIYAIIANGANSAKSSSASYAAAQTFNGVNASSFLVTTKTSNDQHVQVTWDRKDGETYKLEYAKVKNRSNENQEAELYNYELAGAYTAAPLTPANYLQGKAVVDLTTLAIGSNYIFKLTTTVAGVDQTQVALLKGGAFNGLAYFNLIRSDPPAPQAAASLILNLSSVSGYYANKAYSGIELYRREVGSGQATNYVKLTLPTAQQTIAANSLSGWEYQDTDVSVTKQYSYKIVVAGIPAVSSSGEVQVVPYGRDAYVSTIGQYRAAADPIGTASFPAKSLEVSGSKDIGGLTVTIRYVASVNAASQPVYATADLPITRITDTTVASNPQYYYYVVMPTFVAHPSSSANIFLVRYPWDTSDQSGGYMYPSASRTP